MTTASRAIPASLVPTAAVLAAAAANPATTTAAASPVARIGSFAGPTVSFGLPLQTVHPRDNAFPMFEPEIDRLDISLEEKAKLQREAENLTGVLVVGRDLED